MPINQIYPVLTTTPIKEIIFTISYSENVPFEELQKFRNKKDVTKKYSFIADGFAATINSGPEPHTSVIKDGYVLRCVPENKIIQVRQGSFSFHKINEYESFDSLKTEFLKYWKIFLSCVNKKELTINNLSLRYLNFIELIDGESYSEISTIKAVNPFVDELQKYLIRLEFFNEEFKDVIIGLTQAPIMRDQKKGLMLDTNISKKITVHINLDVLLEYLPIMRALKNDVFFKVMTEKALKRFQS